MNAELFQTPSMSDLNIIEAAAIAHTSEEFIDSGDYVRFFCEDSNTWQIGVYATLWFYITNGRETSPFVADNRVMAKIATIQGGVTYADVTTISKIANPLQSAKF